MARILVVDDDPDFLKCVVRQLRRWGHTTLCADSAKTAVAVLAADDVDILVSDLQMPEMDGFALAAMTHATTPTMPVIIMSGTFNTVGVPEPDGMALIPKMEFQGALKAAVERAVARVGSPTASRWRHDGTDDGERQVPPGGSPPPPIGKSSGRVERL